MTKSIFITGASGYIGGTILHEFIQNHKDEYEITAYVRSESSAQKIQATGASVIRGSYEQPELLIDAAKKFDIIIHTGESADHLESAKALLKGISQRPPSAPPVIYIHTSGTGVIADPFHGDVESDRVYDDARPEEIDSLDPKQPHREIDILVRDKAKELKDKAKSAIIIPPNIYGIGTGPVNTVSIQTPALIKFAIKNNFAPRNGPGINWWNNVHVKDLARGYVVLLKQLEKYGAPGWNGYFFAETEQHQWKDIYVTVGKVLHSKGLVDSPDPESPAERLGFKTDYEAITTGSGQVYDAWGSNSRSRASRLRALGWKKEEKEDVLGAIETEVEYIRRQGSK